MNDTTQVRIDPEVVRAWLESPEGQAAFEKALRDGEAAVERLEEARKIPLWMLHEPMTI